jgi:hypothetical protein
MAAGARLAALLLVVLPTGHAVASPATVCRLIPDVPGDAAYGLVTPPARVPLVPGTPGDDLLSADIASDGRRLTAVLRMAEVAVPDPVAPLGRAYTVVFTVQGKGSWFLSARTYATGTQYLYGDFVTQAGGTTASRVLGPARGRIDPARRLVVVDAPASVFAGGLRRGTTLRVPNASVGRWVGQGAVPAQQVAGQQVPLTGGAMSFDDARGRNYVVGTRSCVHPGL